MMSRYDFVNNTMQTYNRDGTMEVMTQGQVAMKHNKDVRVVFKANTNI